jgi:hypothetical protein
LGRAEQVRAAAQASIGNLFVYGDDDVNEMNLPPRLRIDETGQMQIAESVFDDPEGDTRRDVWFPVESVHHLGDWVALTFVFVDHGVREAFRSLAIIPTELYNRVM